MAPSPPPESSRSFLRSSSPSLLVPNGDEDEFNNFTFQEIGDNIVEHNGVQFYQSIQDSPFSSSSNNSNKYESLALPNSPFNLSFHPKLSSIGSRRASEASFKVPLRPFRNHSIVSNVPPVVPTYIPPVPSDSTVLDNNFLEENESIIKTTPSISQSSHQTLTESTPEEGSRSGRRGSKRKSGGWLNFFKSTSPPKTTSNSLRNSSIDDFDIICPVETGIPENQLPSEDDPHIIEMRNKFTEYDLSSTSSLIPENDFTWKTPESWVVLGPDAYNSPNITNSSTNPTITSNTSSPPTEDIDFPKRQIDCLRVYKPQGPNSLFSPNTGNVTPSPTGVGKSSSKKYLKSVTVPITSKTTAAELCQKLAFKWSSNSAQQNELTRYRLYIHHHRTQRLLDHDERPAQLLADHLLTLGYTENDDLSEIARDDHSYFCKFIYREYPPLPPLSQNFIKDPSEPHKPWIDDKAAHLADANLSAIPSILFQKSYTLETMDLTRNNLLTLPMDLLEIMPRLRTLILKGMLLDTIPHSLKLLGDSLTHLDLGSNLLSPASDLSVLSHFSVLTHLDLSCNLLEDLKIKPVFLDTLCYEDVNSKYGVCKDNHHPHKNVTDTSTPTETKAPPQPLSSLRFLNLSSNSFTKIPEIIWTMQDLRDLNMSFNKLTILPFLFGTSFPLLRTLSLVGNQIKDVEGSPFPLDALGNLWHLDLRGNLLTSSPFLSSLLTLPQLRELHVDYNLFGSMGVNFSNVSNGGSAVNGDNKMLSLCSLDKITCICNSLTGISFGAKFLSLKELDLSQSKLFTLPPDLFLSTPLLTELNLNQNELVKLPPSLSSLRHLSILTADLNSLDSVDLSFEGMESLKHLSLHSNNITNVSGDIWLSKGLEYLNLTSNFIQQFPPSPLTPKGSTEPLSLCLKEFLIADNRLDNEISSSISLMKRLRLLNLSFNTKIISLSPDFMLGSHLSIEEVYLSSIGLTAFPEGLEVPQRESPIGFPNLKSIYINNNRIVQLPSWISSFTNLMVIDAQCNKLNYNITNTGWDWNWQSQRDTLKSLNLSNNPSLIVRQSPHHHHNHHHHSNTSSPSISSSLLLFGSGATVDKRPVTDFTQMKQLRSLDVRNVKVEKGSFPTGFSNLSVRKDVDEGRVSLSEYSGRTRSENMIFDKSDLVKYNFMDDELVIALFDGHGNEFISSYLADIFIDCLRLELRENEPPSEALRRAFLSANRKLFSQPVMKQQQESLLKKKKCCSLLEIEEQYSASASLIYIFEGHLIAANVGDCMAVLCREGMAVPLTQRHHAFSSQEQNRIRGMGGSINLHGLVEGETRLTRGFGLHHLLPWITADPWITGDIELGETDEFILLASQSFWSVFVGYQTAVDLARKFVRENTSIPSNGRKLSFDLSVESLRDMAISRGAQGSMKILLVDLESIGSSLRPEKLKGAPSLEHPAITNRKITKSAYGNSPSTTSGIKRQDSMDNKLMINLEAEVQAPQAPCAFVFTDIKNSSELWSLTPNAMHVATKHHNQLIRRLLRIHHGYELKTNGDNFVIAFADSVSAVRFCVAVQRDFLLQDWPNEIINQPSFSPIYGSDQRLLYRGISLRMGIHYGDASRELDIVSRRMDYMGPSVIIAQRVEGCADGGQINITRPVREHLMQQDNTPNKPDVVIHELGMVQLKGIPERQLLFALYPSGLSERRHILSDGSLIKPVIPLLKERDVDDCDGCDGCDGDVGNDDNDGINEQKGRNGSDGNDNTTEANENSTATKNT